jgi:cysteine synthase
LQYCENCATMTRFLNRLGVPYERIDLDLLEYATPEQLGNQYRVALEQITERTTFPQLFVKGVFLGGAVDVCMMWKKDRLQPILTEAGLAGEREFMGYQGDPFEFLPKWMTTNPLAEK